MNPATFLGSTRTKPCVKQVYGVSGSGKTEFLNAMVRAAAKSREFGPLHRFIVFDVKHSGYADIVELPATTINGAVRQLSDERVVVIHPSIEEAGDMLDDIIGWMFYTAEQLGEEFSATLIVEESSTYIGSHAAAIPDSIKRMATQGRGFGFSLLLVNQRSLSNKWTDTQSDSLVMFRLAIPDSLMLKTRWGVVSETMNERLAEKKFSFAVYDLESLDMKYYAPIKYSDRPRKPVTGPYDGDKESKV